DMSQVEYVSSGGWGVFTERLREVRRAGGDIKLFGMDPDVYYVFTMLGFNIVLSSFDILADAIEDFRAPRSDVESVRAVPAMADDEPAARSTPAPGPAPRLASSAPGMDIVWESARAGVRVARISGVIETTAVSLLADELSREISLQPPGIVFDLSRVEYISSSGWGQFARAYDATRAVALCGMGPDLDEVYACLEFHSFLPAFAGEDEALAAVLERRAAPPPAPVVNAPPPPDDDEDVLAPGSGLDDVLGGTPRVETPGIERATPPPAAEEPVADEPAFGLSSWAPKNDGHGGDVDVAGALADRNKGRDNKLRALGWEKYGKRLKNRADAGKLKEQGGGPLDPHEDETK
ncbi:MAG TPA: STAS domain-containing protein, partial [Candidatus Krumholzibacteria bacterium]